ncbi:hypothetical protein E2542_SST10962 [Spatholobus suberectus]|nr:hypothetical protein E2542_SST10962 [Spatholobus suberectus]
MLIGLQLGINQIHMHDKKGQKYFNHFVLDSLSFVHQRTEVSLICIRNMGFTIYQDYTESIRKLGLDRGKQYCSQESEQNFSVTYKGRKRTKYQPTSQKPILTVAVIQCKLMNRCSR